MSDEKWKKKALPTLKYDPSNYSARVLRLRAKTREIPNIKRREITINLNDKRSIWFIKDVALLEGLKRADERGVLEINEEFSALIISFYLTDPSLDISPGDPKGFRKRIIERFVKRDYAKVISPYVVQFDETLFTDFKQWKLDL